MRRSGLFLIYTLVNVIFLCLLLVHAAFEQKASVASLRKKSALVKKLGITDLCLFTEASYTRHLSQADFHTPFQDGPLSLEHFPSGALLLPPPALK